MRLRVRRSMVCLRRRWRFSGKGGQWRSGDKARRRRLQRWRLQRTCWRELGKRGCLQLSAVAGASPCHSLNPEHVQWVGHHPLWSLWSCSHAMQNTHLHPPNSPPREIVNTGPRTVSYWHVKVHCVYLFVAPPFPIEKSVSLDDTLNSTCIPLMRGSFSLAP